MGKKKKLFWVSSFLIALALLSCLGISFANDSASINTKTYTNVTQVYTQIRDGYNGGTLGPIMIVNGTLNNGKSITDTYWVFLSGTEFVDGQGTGIVTDILAGFELDNDYLKAVLEAIKADIPKNSNIVLSGHSLGGMVAQQVSADKTIKTDYNIQNVVTFGSPLVCPTGREGTVKRLGDKNDVIPYLSSAGVILPLNQIFGLNREDGKYAETLVAHSKSYSRTDLWGAYDVLGIKNGNATYTFNADNLKHSKCPETVFSLSYQADSRAQEAMQSTDKVTVTKTDNFIEYKPAQTTSATAFIFYPGAMVSPESYSQIMAGIANNGNLAITAKMPIDLAILGISAADGIIKAYPNIKHWYIGGHSLGGSMASTYASLNDDKIDGIVFLASYASSSLRRKDIKALSLYGSNDKVLSSFQYKLNKINLPSDFTEFIIDGGNHGQFGDYGIQKGDGTATLSAKEQQQTTIDKITEFMK